MSKPLKFFWLFLFIAMICLAFVFRLFSTVFAPFIAIMVLVAVNGFLSYMSKRQKQSKKE